MKYLILTLFLSSFTFYNSKNLGNTPPAIGDSMSNISMESPEGTTIQLDDLKGHVVLVDFWASWCKPCRMENKNLVKTYDHFKSAQFKNGGSFKIYSISLDKNKTAWTNAIKTDQLVWNTHVSDLKGWYSQVVREFGINAIPQNILIDQDGTIIAKNLRGQALDKVLETLTK